MSLASGRLAAEPRTGSRGCWDGPVPVARRIGAVPPDARMNEPVTLHTTMAKLSAGHRESAAQSERRRHLAREQARRRPDIGVRTRTGPVHTIVPLWSASLRTCRRVGHRSTGLTTAWWPPRSTPRGACGTGTPHHQRCQLRAVQRLRDDGRLTFEYELGPRDELMQLRLMPTEAHRRAHAAEARRFTGCCPRRTRAKYELAADPTLPLPALARVFPGCAHLCPVVHWGES